MIPRSPVPDSRFRTAAKALASAFGLAAAVLLPAHALETVFAPFKNGYVNTQHFNGSARILQVGSGDAKAWVQHALPNAAGADLAAARLSLFVKDVIRDGTLKVYLAAAPRGLEQQSRLDELKASGDAVGALAIKARDAIEEQVSIPMSAAFAAAVKAGTFVGLVLEGADGLNVELGAQPRVRRFGLRRAGGAIGFMAKRNRQRAPGRLPDGWRIERLRSGPCDRFPHGFRPAPENGHPPDPERPGKGPGGARRFLSVERRCRGLPPER